MRRGLLSPLIVGWLLGLLTAFVWPAVTVERRSYVPGPFGPSVVAMGLGQLADEGWVVTRTDTAGGVSIYLLERARYLAVAEQLERWSWDITSSWRGPVPRPTPAPPKPTEAPKPAAPAASPRAP